MAFFLFPPLQEVDRLGAQVARFNRHTDLDRVQEVAADVKHIRRDLNKCVEQAKLFNNREVLFGEEQTEYLKLQATIKEFEPFYQLWTNADDWLKVGGSRIAIVAPCCLSVAIPDMLSVLLGGVTSGMICVSGHPACWSLAVSMQWKTSWETDPFGELVPEDIEKCVQQVYGVMFKQSFVALHHLFTPFFGDCGCLVNFESG